MVKEKKIFINVNSKSGFTLIELLVVISILGILISVVITSLTKARIKAADAAIRSNMSNLRTQADVWYESNSFSYNKTGLISDTCGTPDTFFADARVVNIISEIIVKSNSSPVCYIEDTGEKWAVSTSLVTVGDTWCVDNSGWSAPGVAIDTGTCS